MFASMLEPTYVEHLSGDPLKGKLSALPTNILIIWKGLQGANAPAYQEHNKLQP
jgi:hypothetical protein